MSKQEPTLRTVLRAQDVAHCFRLLVQLRPNLVSEAEFVAYWTRQRKLGYRLVTLSYEKKLLALAGYRMQENLVYGRHLYIDDLVTDVAVRSSGHGARLLQWLRNYASRSRCDWVVLDTPLSNVKGQQFYFRCGLLAASLRFTCHAG